MAEDSKADASLRAEMALLAQRAGITLTEDELASLAPTVSGLRAELEQLRKAIRLEEEPAHTFSKQVRGSRL